VAARKTQAALAAAWPGAAGVAPLAAAVHTEQQGA
jgi:hypothetical protein